MKFTLIAGVNPHLIYAPRGCAAIRKRIMSAKADPNRAPRLAGASLDLEEIEHEIKKYSWSKGNNCG